MKKLLAQYSGLKKEIYILFIGKLVTAMGSFVWPMLTFFLTTKLGFSDGFATLLLAIATLLMLPAALLGGKLADRFSRKKIIILFDCCTFLLYVAAFLLPISNLTAVLVFFGGLFQTIESPAYDAINADFSTPQQREKAYSLSYLGMNLGFIVGAGLAGLLFEKHTNLCFLLNGISVIFSTVLIVFFVHMENTVKNSEPGSDLSRAYGEYELPVEDTVAPLAILRERKAVLWMMLISCISAMPNTLSGVMLPLQLKEQLGEHGAAVYGSLNSLNGLTVILLTPILTMRLRKITEIPKSIAGVLFFVIGILIFAVGSPIWLLYLGMFLFTVGEVSSVLGHKPYFTRRIPASHWGRVGGINSVISSIFQTVTGFLISGILTISHSNYVMIWVTFAGFGVTAAVLYLLLYREDRKTFPALYAKAPQK